MSGLAKSRLSINFLKKYFFQHLPLTLTQLCDSRV